jgi:hypothetical protein
MTQVDLGLTGVWLGLTGLIRSLALMTVIKNLVRHIFLWISLRGSWVSSLCLYMDDLDPSNGGNHCGFVVFRMNSSFRCSST